LANQRPGPDEQTNDNLLYQNQLLSQEIRRRVDQLAAINTVAASVSQSLDLEKTLETALDAVLGVIRVEAAGISLVDDTASELVLRAQRGWKLDFVSEPMRIPLGEGISGAAVRNDKVIVTGDLADDPRLAVPEFAEEGVQAMALVPMHARGRVVGILSVMNYAPYNFTDEEITVLRAIADQVGIALDNARLYEHAKEQSSRLGAVLHSSGDAIIATDNRGYINLINSTAEELFDVSRHEVAGTSLRHAPLHPRLREGLRRAINNAQHGNTAFEVTLENGRFLSAIVSPVYSRQSPESNQHAEGWVLVIRDITHLRKAEQARINFIHAAAHDLRNPLGATLSALAMLQHDLGNVSETHEEIISIGIQSIDRMQNLIDNLLSLEHIESGVGVQAVQVDVHELLERCIVDLQTCVQQRNQTLHLEIADPLPAISGDIHWLYHALFNLLCNANKYTPEQGDITLRAYVREAELYLEVEDNGPGIPPETQARLFERFYRANTDETVKGTGLGLSIVKSVAEQHNGRTFVQSQPGQGSIFGIVLPVSDEA
jgi:PAS domain S-box-containing protein